MEDIIRNAIKENQLISQDLLENHLDKIISFSKIISNSIKKGGTVFWCGNGGSSSDSQHLAAELIGRFKKTRKPLKSLSLNADGTILAIGDSGGEMNNIDNNGSNTNSNSETTTRILY